MPFSLTPRWVFQHYSEITPDWLRERGITLLLSDLDFTLAAKKTRRPDGPLRDWIAALRAAGAFLDLPLGERRKFYRPPSEG